MKNKIMKRLIMTAALTLAAAGTLGSGSETKAQPLQGEESVYCVGSVSKVYVTAAVMRLVDEGKVELDRPVTEYLPAFQMADPRYKDITVRMLMDHTSGIMGTSQIGSFLYESNDTWHHDHLLDTLKGQRLKADPGSYAAYCNDGFDLLELIVEAVSGMSYTEYVTSKIALPTGGTATGTSYNFMGRDDLAPAYNANNLLYDNESCMCIGAGGVFSTASDVARFGTAFYKGNGSLLSEKQKEEMTKLWDGKNPDAHKDKNGLGWDRVSKEKYEKQGVQVLEKGGDVLLNHACLMVAPKEKISIAVLSNGGSSSYNSMLAEAIMDTVLEEAGINVTEDEREFEIEGTVPEEMDEFAGCYVTQNALEGGTMISKVSFPQHAYMHVENISPVSTSVKDYAYTAEGSFAELAFEVEDGMEDVRIAANPNVLRFVKQENGKVTISCEGRMVAAGLGSVFEDSYIGEKLEENPVGGEQIAAWEKICGQNLFLCNDVPASASYQYAIIRMALCEEVPGYVFYISGQGTRLLKILDESHAQAFQSIPSSANRDLIDLSISSGEEGTVLISSSGPAYRTEEGIREFRDSGDVPDQQGVTWFRIGESIANATVSIDRPENCAVYVYNKYGDVVYNSHVKNASFEIPMPKDGHIVFIR